MWVSLDLYLLVFEKNIVNINVFGFGLKIFWWNFLIEIGIFEINVNRFVWFCVILRDLERNCFFSCFLIIIYVYFIVVLEYFCLLIVRWLCKYKYIKIC